jgi:hypothetical protein
MATAAYQLYGAEISLFTRKLEAQERPAVEGWLEASGLGVFLP